MSQRLTARLTASMMIVGFLLLAACLGTAWYVNDLQRRASAILTLNVSSMRAAEELEINLREVRNKLDAYLKSGERKHLGHIPLLRTETDRWMGEAEKVATTEREQELMARVRSGYTHFFKELDRVASRPAEGPSRREMRSLIDRVLTDEILLPAHEYLDLNEELAAEAAARNQRAAGWTVLVLVLLGVCGPVAGLMAGIGIGHRLDRALVRLSLPILDAAGRLSEVVEPITLKPGWGVEDLEGVLERMAMQVGEVIERMQRSQREALRAEQLASLGQLAAGVAHELRNPLMSMKLLVQAAAARGEAGLRGRDLAVLEEEITRLERLTSTLLDYARPPQPETRAVVAGALVEDVAGLLSGMAGRRDVRLECELPGRPVWLEADSGQVRQVLLNLLLNAVDAVQDGGTVLVRLLDPAAPDASVEIEVEDTGPGLPACLGKDIFAPFVSTKPTGLGLGLSICQRIAEGHGGEVTASERAGGGAVFRVRLPGRAPRPAPPPEAALSPPPHGKGVTRAYASRGR